MKQLKLNPECQQKDLINFGFKKYGMNYKMFIPLYQRNNETLIELEILISSVDHYIGYDVLDKCNNTLYMAFYDKEKYGENLVLDTVQRNLEETFRSLADNNIITKRCLKVA